MPFLERLMSRAPLEVEAEPDEIERQNWEPGQERTFLEAFFGARTGSGVRVTVPGSLSLPAVYASIRILADGVAATPLPVYRLGADDTRQKAKDTWQWRLFHDRPNPEMTAPMFGSTMMAHLAGYGESFIGKDYELREGFPVGSPTALWPIHPEQIRVARLNGRKLYFYRDASGIERPRPYTEREVIHIVGLSLDGMRGISPIEAARKAIAAGLAMTDYTDSFYGNASLPSGVLSTDKELADPAFERVRRRWNMIYSGRKNAGKVAILEEGLSFEPISVSQRDAQFVESMQMSIADVARLFRIPMSRLDANPQGGSLTYRTVESDDHFFALHSLRPWFVRIEEAFRTDPNLFPDDSLFPEYLMDAVMRAQTKERYETYAIALGGKPFMRPSEPRALENLPADPELDDEAKAPDPIELAKTQAEIAAKANGGAGGRELPAAPADRRQPASR